ncbi:shikimate dehydrogenase [Bacillus sp. AFS055030]|uniref:shikimate dehydrogenase n=1 Tax=Bacillus sp. AFS055030 TaxID=2033507 RepID=UPI000BFC8CFE|nr:shikimate dehydrogenase [Bacillus sp. AFS055030]PGL70512.1 shikimate dehydrogenase [Bacillus sp. AFS055030]
MKDQYYVIGQPIGHSMSPTMHNEWFDSNHISGHYLAKEVGIAELKSVMTEFRSTVKGFNVTAPLKVEIMQYLDEIDPLAKAIGAVNTVINKNGKLYGKNTDGIGYCRGLSYVLKNPIEEEKILIIGAGGAARAILYSLLHLGVKRITVTNRTLEKAEALLDGKLMNEVNIMSISDAEEHLGQFSLIIQTTSVGMKPNENSTPLALTNLLPDAIVSDLIYSPFKTVFLKEAEERNATIQNGLPMFIYQGALAFQEWTGIFPNTIDAYSLLERKLGGTKC